MIFARWPRWLATTFCLMFIRNISFMQLQPSSAFLMSKPIHLTTTTRCGSSSRISNIKHRQSSSRRNISSSSNNNNNNDNNSNKKDPDMLALEREVRESAAAKLDLRRVQRALIEQDNANGSNVGIEDGLQSSSTTSSSIGSNSWKIPLSAGVASSVVSYLWIPNIYLSLCLFMVVVFVANGDPMEEETVAGSLARVVGRATIEGYGKSKAVARAAIRGDQEILELKSEIENLKSENAELRLWKTRRLAVDANLSNYNLEDLKDTARSNGRKIGGTKTQLLMRLVEAGLVELD